MAQLSSAYSLSAAYVLRPRGTLRVGTHPHDLARSAAFPSSDTLFGALAWAYKARFGGQAFQTWLDEFRIRPPALWTSALPALVVDDALHVMLPMPARRPGFRQETREGAGASSAQKAGDVGARPRPGQETVEDRKLLRRARYLDSSLWGWFVGASVEQPERIGQALLPTNLADRVREAAEAVVRTSRSPWHNPTRVGASLWDDNATRPRVAVDRLSAAPALFSSAFASFLRAPDHKVDVGLAVCVLAAEARAWDWLDACFEVLAEVGLGGQRSIGRGQFDWVRQDCPVPLSARPSGPLLSLCWPRPDEVAAGALRLGPDLDLGYRLTERMGWVASPDWNGYRSRAVAMLAEGSYVGGSLAEPVGGLADVTPDPSQTARHPVYRYGYGCFRAEEPA